LNPERLTHRVVRLTVVALAGLGLASAATASGAEPEGAALLAQLQSGQRSCGGLSAADFAQIGHYDMGQIMGSVADAGAMDARLRASVGTRQAELADRFMGERLGGCATGTGPVSFGTLMGLMGSSEMGASDGSGYRNGSSGDAMMGSDRSGGGGASATAIAAIVLGGLLVAALILWRLAHLLPRRPTISGS
jgi:hypothetical protein